MKNIFFYINNFLSLIFKIINGINKSISLLFDIIKIAIIIKLIIIGSPIISFIITIIKKLINFLSL